MKRVKIINIGIIGNGYHYNKNIKNIFIKLKKINPIILKKKKNVYDYNNFYLNKIDFIYINTPARTHFKIVKECLNKKLNVICEKPVAENYQQAKNLTDIAIKNKLCLMETFVHEYHPVFFYLKKKIKNNKNSLKYIISNFTIPRLNKKNNRYNKKTGNGFFNDLAVYLLAVESNLVETSKKKIKIIQKTISKSVPLKGYINIRNKKSNHFYFWGEGQAYANNIKIEFNNMSIFVNNFFSKILNKEIEVLLHQEKLKKIRFKPTDQFELMFKTILNNFKNKKFILENIKKILLNAELKEKIK